MTTFKIGFAVLALASAAQITPPTFTPLKPGAPAPDFKAVDENDRPVHLSDYDGKIVVLDIWATWCVPCNKAFPHLDSLQSQTKNQNVVVLALCSDTPPADFEKWRTLNKGKFSFTILRDPNVTMAQLADPQERVKAMIKEMPTWIARKSYPVTSLPTTYVIRDHKVVTRPRGLDDLAATLESLKIKLDRTALSQDNPEKEGIPVAITRPPKPR